MQAQKQFFWGLSKSPTLYPKRNRKATSSGIFSQQCCSAQT